MKQFLPLSLLLFCSSITSFGQQPIDVTEQTIKIGGFKTEELYFGFAAGDQIVFSFIELDGRDIKEVELIQWPSTAKFSDYKTAGISDKRLTVISPAVFIFRFHNSALRGRVCKIKIQRIPVGEATRAYNTTVSWISKQDTTWNNYIKEVVAAYDTAYEQKTKRVVVKTEQREELLVDKSLRVHSSSNSNGSKTSMFFTLPVNESSPDKTSKVVAWAYWIGVGEAAAKSWQQNTAVVKTLIKGAATYYATPLGALAVGAVMDLATPILGDNVQYAITDEANRNLFLGSRPFRLFDQGNGIAGYRKFTNKVLSQGTYFICLANDNLVQGIDASVKVIAIVETVYYEDQPFTEMKVTPRYEKKMIKEPKVSMARIPVAG